MTIDLKHPRYVLPIIVLPFICILFYVYKSSFAKEKNLVATNDSLQTGLVDVSDQVLNQNTANKLEAFRELYKNSDGYTAIGAIEPDQDTGTTPPTSYNLQERQMLDSIDRAMKMQYKKNNTFPDALQQLRNQSLYLKQDNELAKAIANIQNPQSKKEYQQADHIQQDPVDIFRRQMQLVDSMGKANDPEFQAEQKRIKIRKEEERSRISETPVPVKKSDRLSAEFNTVIPQQTATFITAIVDQDIKGYTGSRLRIRLLDDIIVGKIPIKKGTYVYAQITGFTGQRVNLSIHSIMLGQQIIPIKLDVYDHDGLIGLYVPASAFREFTKDFGNSASQGLTMQQAAENNSQLVMSMVQKLFQSTSTAVSKMIRQNKANIKYSTLVYLIDPQQIQKYNSSNL